MSHITSSDPETHAIRGFLRCFYAVALSAHSVEKPEKLGLPWLAHAELVITG